MGGKRERSESELETETGFSNRKKHKMKGEGEEKEKEKKEILPSMIKNKEKRSAVHAKIKLQKKLEKRKRAKARDAAEKRALELGEEVSLFFSFFLLILKFFFNQINIFIRINCFCLVLFINAAAAEERSPYN